MSTTDVPCDVEVQEGTEGTLSTLSDARPADKKRRESWKSNEHEELEELLIGYVRAKSVESIRGYLARKNRVHLASSFNRVLNITNLRKDKLGKIEVSTSDAINRIVTHLASIKKVKADRCVKLAEEKQILTANEEKVLVELCGATAVMGWGLDKNKMLKVINSFLAMTGVEFQATKKIVDKLMERSHGSLTLVGCSSLEVARAEQATEAVRDAAFAKAECGIRLLHAMGLLPWPSMTEVPSRNKYNMDEISTNTVARRRKILCKKNKYDKRFFQITPEGDGRMSWHVTCALTTRADGTYSPF
jgi:hypothetical protein